MRPRVGRPAPGAAALGVVVDALVGDPSDRWHPTAWLGTTMLEVERRLHRDSIGVGAVHALTGASLGFVAGVVTPAPIAVATATGGRGLQTTATRIGSALAAGDLSAARQRLPWLVGRDPSDLDAAEIARATVESVAENSVDSLVAPALWAAAFGSAGALVHRAVNTMDAMVGHRSDRYERYGKAAARLDDVMAWVPARATAVLVAAVRPHRAGAIWRTVRRDAGSHPSPNAGVAEAAFAAALDVRLGGTNRYGDRVEHRPLLGSGRAVEAHDIARAVRLLGHVRAALVAMLLVAEIARRTGRSTPRPTPPRSFRRHPHV